MSELLATAGDDAGVRGAGWRFDNSYAKLPEILFARQSPVPVREPRLIRINRALAARLGLDAQALMSEAGAAIFAGNAVPEGAEPIAQAYAGHQFGHFTLLGDGRAILLGEIVTPDGARFDIQLKGSGQTPFSRRGDGRAALGPVMREYIVSEAMARLGIPTTRSLAIATTGEPVYRETVLPGAVLTRVAASHIRVGTFEYAAVRGDMTALKALADHVIARHYPELLGEAEPYLRLFDAVMERQAALVARWMAVGFIHGVMNTDNMSIAGETIDYGPCAFMDAYHHATVFSSIDYQGRYAYANQPAIAQWNLARFAETLLPLINEDRQKAAARAQAALATFPARFKLAWVGGMKAKLGLVAEDPEDLMLIQSWLKLMEDHGADFTNSFRALADAVEEGQGEARLSQAIPDAAALSGWLARWRARLKRDWDAPAKAAAVIRASNPAYIARNHRVEAAIRAGVESGDFTLMDRLVAVLSKPFEDQPEHSAYAEPPSEAERVRETFCGT